LLNKSNLSAPRRPRSDYTVCLAVAIPFRKVKADYCPAVGDNLASQPTLSRFENAIGVRWFFRLRDRLLDQFIASFKCQSQDDLEYVMRRPRAVWPDVHIHLRGDSGFGTPAMYDAFEQLDIQYTIGLGMNARLKKHSDLLLKQAVLQ
jgi:hypothetical protein